jgi:hypothetical protein
MTTTNGEWPEYCVCSFNSSFQKEITHVPARDLGEAGICRVTADLDLADEDEMVVSAT